MNDKKTLNPKNAAAEYDLNEGTLRNWRYKGIGPPYIKRNGKILYEREDLEKWLNEGKVKTHA